MYMYSIIIIVYYILLLFLSPSPSPWDVTIIIINYHYAYYYHYKYPVYTVYLMSLCTTAYISTPMFSINLMIHGSSWNDKTCGRIFTPTDERLVHLKMEDEPNLESDIPGGGWTNPSLVCGFNPSQKY